MSIETFLRGFFSALISIGFAWMVFSRNESELGYNDRQRYLPYVSGVLLPLMLLTYGLLELWFYGVQRMASMMLSLFFGIFLHISIY